MCLQHYFVPLQFFDCFLVKTEECAWSGREAFIEKSVFTPSFIPVLKTFWTNKEEKLAFYCTMTWDDTWAGSVHAASCLGFRLTVHPATEWRRGVEGCVYCDWVWLPLSPSFSFRTFFGGDCHVALPSDSVGTHICRSFPLWYFAAFWLWKSLFIEVLTGGRDFVQSNRNRGRRPAGRGRSWVRALQLTPERKQTTPPSPSSPTTSTESHCWRWAPPLKMYDL